ncbi:MAG: hypothetical protein KDE58_40380 [Caldilineaceae bacterium]|nr:hypothetical protein [Caldilineaceae bacterium]
MVRVKRDRPGNNPLKQSFVERVRTRNVVPILSNEMMADLVMCGRARFTEGDADYIEYSLTERSDLLRIAKFIATTEDLEDYDLKFDFLNFVKNHFCNMAEAEGINPEKLDEVAEEMDALAVSDFAGRLGYPEFPGGATDPLLILADLPLPVYLTTSPHTFIEAALQRAGKSPVTDYCRWHPGLTDQVVTYRPTPGQPLVFHLFGNDWSSSMLSRARARVRSSTRDLFPNLRAASFSGVGNY